MSDEHRSNSMDDVKARILLWAIQIVGVIVICAVALGGMYWLTGLVDQISARWWATVATLLLPAVGFITWRLSARSSHEHLAGFERGLSGAERTVESMGRSLAATASLARSTRQIARPMNDDLLPRGSMQIVEAKQSDQIVEI